MTPPISASIQLAADQVNAQGGILGGGTLSIVTADGGCDATTAANAADRLVNTDQVTAIVGGMCSGETIAGANNAGIPGNVVMVSPASTSPALTTLADNDLVLPHAAVGRLSGPGAGAADHVQGDHRGRADLRQQRLRQWLRRCLRGGFRCRGRHGRGARLARGRPWRLPPRARHAVGDRRRNAGDPCLWQRVGPGGAASGGRKRRLHAVCGRRRHGRRRAVHRHRSGSRRGHDLQQAGGCRRCGRGSLQRVRHRGRDRSDRDLHAAGL